MFVCLLLVGNEDPGRPPPSKSCRLRFPQMKSEKSRKNVELEEKGETGKGLLRTESPPPIAFLTPPPSTMAELST